MIFFIMRKPPSSKINFDSIDIALPSNSTGSSTGTIQLRIYLPEEGNTRYPSGAPVLIWGYGGGDPGALGNPLPPVNDSIVINFLYPGGKDEWADQQSDGVYDYRGENSIAALRDVILFAAGELKDDIGRTIDEIVPVTVLHDNIGLLGASFGGNIIVAVAAFHGVELTDYLQFIIQWETPVSSQIATLDLGRVLPAPGEAGTQLDLYNPRYLAFGKQQLAVNYSDLTFNPTNEYYPIFHDGTGDGEYTTIPATGSGLQTPDLNFDGSLSLEEDFPINYFMFEPINSKRYYSRSVTHALRDNNITAPWPSEIATPEEADAFWDIREAVRLYDQAVSKMPHLKAMVLCNERDHVQSHPAKPHIQQAFDGWNDQGVWVRINPSPSYVRGVNPTITIPSLPDNSPNVPPSNWSDHASYCIPKKIGAEIYQAAAFWEMADLVQENIVTSCTKQSTILLRFSLLRIEFSQMICLTKIDFKIAKLSSY
ncbi:MAG: hypothetical protein GF308_03020 [Candidatus Heimdallarchaeota archaeon]|nr:hypothetical protein [Candidatus Heimdallarchaeota archaeon]